MTEIDTREKLVLAAERLFAEKGIDNVSLREINRAAGQKNVAALHYHFGAREALLEAIFEHRMSRINRRRVALLDGFEANGATPGIRQMVEAMVLPLAEQLDGGAKGGNYIRFLAQAISDPGVDIGGLVRDKFDHGMTRTRTLARSLLADKPPQIVDERMRLVAAHMVHALADKARRLASGRHPDRADETALFISNLIDGIAGALTAPVSEETMAMFANTTRKTA